jgi:hypothetical protein
MEYEDERRMPPAQTARRGIVPETTSLAEATVVEMLMICMERTRAARSNTELVAKATAFEAEAMREEPYTPGDPDPVRAAELSAAAREFSMAITHIEDAITRFNKGTYMARGTFAISDAERS